MSGKEPWADRPSSSPAQTLFPFDSPRSHFCQGSLKHISEARRSHCLIQGGLKWQQKLCLQITHSVLTEFFFTYKSSLKRFYEKANDLLWVLLQFNNTLTPDTEKHQLKTKIKSLISQLKQQHKENLRRESYAAGIKRKKSHTKHINTDFVVHNNNLISKQASFVMSLLGLVWDIVENAGTYPNLQFHPLIIPINCFHFEVNSYCADKGWRESVISISEEEGCFTHTAVPNDQEFEHVIKVLIRSIFLPVSGICYWSHLEKKRRQTL